jgi:hypothetical protein
MKENYLCLIKQFWSLGLSLEETENFKAFDPTSIILIYGTEWIGIMVAFQMQLFILGMTMKVLVIVLLLMTQEPNFGISCSSSSVKQVLSV